MEGADRRGRGGAEGGRLVSDYAADVALAVVFVVFHWAPAVADVADVVVVVVVEAMVASWMIDPMLKRTNETLILFYCIFSQFLRIYLLPIPCRP